jgi:hypothetical protein
MKTKILALLLSLISSLAYANFVGEWTGKHIRLDIKQEGNLYLVVAHNPNGIVNGTFQGRIVDGEMVLNQKTFGTIAYVKSQDTLLFAGETLKRKSAQALATEKMAERNPNDGLLKRLSHRYMCDAGKVYWQYQAEQRGWVYSANCVAGGCGKHSCSSTEGKALLAHGTGRDIFLDTPCLRGTRYERWVMPNGEFKLRDYKGKPQQACEKDGVHEFTVDFFSPT